MELANEVVYELLKGYSYNSSEVYLSEERQSNAIDVFVYASGKTGSTSVFEGFKQIKKNVMHLHGSRYFAASILKMELDKEFKVLGYINYLTKYNKKILIVDVVREPIGRKISAFFQHLYRLSFIKNKFDSKTDINRYYLNNISKLVELFNEYYLIQKENYYSFDEFTDDELYVRSLPFNHLKKRIYLTHNDKRYLVIRFEDIKLWDNIFQDIGFSGFILPHENRAEEKSISELYKKFKENYFLSKEMLDKIYYEDHKEVLQQFYTEEELSKLYDKWLAYVR